jgi:hypothetical protein
MARITGNAFARGLSGKFKDVIFRWRFGKAVVSRLPDYSNMKWSKRQKQTRIRFRDASRWARENLERPEVAQYYRKLTKRGHARYNRAISDYMKRLRVTIRDLDHYQGIPGDTISIRIPDINRVVRVQVMIYNRKSELIDHGEAVMDQHSGNFIFIASALNPLWKKGILRVTVFNPVASIPQHFSL